MFIIITESNARTVYISVEHIISVFADTDSAGSNVKVSDGKIYKAVEPVEVVIHRARNANAVRI